MTNQDEILEQDSSKGLSFSEIIAWWRSNWRFVSVSTVVCLILAAAYILYTPSKYTRTSSFTLKYFANGRPMMPDIVELSNLTGMYFSNTLDNEMAFFNSQTLLNAIVNRLGLQYCYFQDKTLGRSQDLYGYEPVKVQLLDAETRQLERAELKLTIGKDSTITFSNFIIDGQPINSQPITIKTGETTDTPAGKLSVYATDNFSAFSDKSIHMTYASTFQTVNDIRKRFSFTLTDKYSTVIQFTFTDESMQRADDFLNILPIVYNELWTGQMKEAARKALPIIAEKLQSLEKELAETEIAMADYMSDNSITTIDNDKLRIAKEQTEYDRQDFAIKTQIQLAQEIYDIISTDGLHAIPLPTGITSTHLLKMVTEYNRQLGERERLIAASGKNHPKIREINKQLTLLKNNITSSALKHIRELEIKRDLIAEKKSQIQSSIPDAANNELALTILERRQKTKQDIYLYMLKKRESQLMASLTDIQVVRIISNANGSNMPDSQSSALVLGIALVLGLFGVPIGFFILWKSVDNSVHTSAELKEIGLDVIGDIPQHGRLPIKKRISNLLKIHRPDSRKPMAIANPSNNDATNESLRRIRGNLDFAARDRHEILLLTSINPGSGKTFISLNLAMTMAFSGKRTLLVDLDLRRATLSKCVNSPRTGIAAYLNGTAKIEEVILKNSLTENLHILPVGSLPLNPAELLASDKFQQLMLELKELYDFIFIDSAPVNAASDTASISRCADRTLFVVRAGMLEKRQISSIKDFRTTGALPNLSLILNGVDQPRIHSF